MVVNYRNEPLALRVRNPFTNTQAAGDKGDLSMAFRSMTREDPLLNVQPSFYPRLTKGVKPTDLHASDEVLRERQGSDSDSGRRPGRGP